MKTISIYKLNYRKPAEIKIICTGFGTCHIHYLVFYSLVELSTSLTTLKVFGFTIVKAYLRDSKGLYNTAIEL